MSDEHVEEITAGTVTARGFFLVDRDDRVRANLHAAPDGAVMLDLNDKNGCPRIQIQLDEAGNPFIALFTKDSSVACSLMSDTNRGNGLSINDGGGRPMVSIGAIDNGCEVSGYNEPHITVFDRDGNICWRTTCED
ncbi:hypothetical protein OAS39_04585 [Pirellulales bacterium]|nr:hypothetical protein [Pirellulales bacterium]